MVCSSGSLRKRRTNYGFVQKTDIARSSSRLFYSPLSAKKEISWNMAYRRAFFISGYLFVISDEVESLFFSLKKLPYLTKLLGDQEQAISLYPEEVMFLTQMAGRERCIQMSYGYIEGDQVIITEGAMVNFHGKIKYIDRHKREAVIEVVFFGGQPTDIKVGLEIIKKINKKEDVQL